MQQLANYQNNTFLASYSGYMTRPSSLFKRMRYLLHADYNVIRNVNIFGAATPYYI